MRFWVKTYRFIKMLFPKYVWSIPNEEQKVYLTFDDGPIPEITEWVLDQLALHHAKATFFCIGDNIDKLPAIFQKIIAQKHSIGNHTYNHLKGWKTNTATYLENMEQCQASIQNQGGVTTHLFRPPYGKIKRMQAKVLLKKGYSIIMWEVLSRDFDTTISKEECLQNVLQNIQPGSIIVFHDSIKAFPNLHYALPKTLEYLKEKGFVCVGL